VGLAGGVALSVVGAGGNAGGKASMCWSRCWAERSRVRGWATVGMECCADLWSFAVIDAFSLREPLHDVPCLDR
jgi:hypothetical protein